MSQPLPYGGFEWLRLDTLEYFDVLNIDDESKYGYILEVNLKYPFSLHNDLPFCPKNNRPTLSYTLLKIIIFTLIYVKISQLNLKL